MTRATSRPVRRAVATMDGELVAEVRDRTLTLRPVRTRVGGPAEIVVSWGHIYLRAMIDRVEDTRRAKRRARSRR
jgi:hypothetical protein